MPNKSEYHVTPFCINKTTTIKDSSCVQMSCKIQKSDSLTQSQWKCYVCYNIYKKLYLLLQQCSCLRNG